MKKFFFFSLLFLIGIFALFQMDLGKKPIPGCAFCEKKILENQTFYEGKNVLALVTYKPVVYGHVLVIPKRHVVRFEDLREDEIVEIHQTIQKIDQNFQDKVGNQDYLLLQKNGPLAGQSVPHVHFHYIPGEKNLLSKFLISYLHRTLNPEEVRRLKETFSEWFSEPLKEVEGFF